jgi:hypothetical protein
VDGMERDIQPFFVIEVVTQQRLAGFQLIKNLGL